MCVKAFLGVTIALSVSPISSAYSIGFVRSLDRSSNDLPVVDIPKDLLKSLPDVLDWSAKGAVTPVRQQGHCSSCWAYSVTESLESAAFIQTGRLPQLSEQELISCDSSDHGCEGGDPPVAYDYVKKLGLATMADYPDTSSNSSQSGTCRPKIAAKVKLVSWAYAVPPCTGGSCEHQNEDGLRAALYKFGPLSVCVNAMEADPQPDSADWQAYKGGILKGTCRGSYRALNHCVQLVGYNMTEKTWKVRNSWSEAWGEAGYVRLPMGVNSCGIADEATFVQNVTFISAGGIVV